MASSNDFAVLLEREKELKWLFVGFFSSALGCVLMLFYISLSGLSFVPGLFAFVFLYFVVITGRSLLVESANIKLAMQHLIGWQK